MAILWHARRQGASLHTGMQLCTQALTVCERSICAKVFAQDACRTFRSPGCFDWTSSIDCAWLSAPPRLFVNMTGLARLHPPSSTQILTNKELFLDQVMPVLRALHGVLPPVRVHARA